MAQVIRCPYTLRLIDSVKANREHVIPHALGGSLDYSVLVAADLNSQLGSTIDDALTNSALVRARKLQFGIDSYSGPPTWRVNGVMAETGREVSVTFRANEDATVHVTKPIVMSQDGKSGDVLIPSAQYDQFLATFIENHRKKGRIVILGEEKSFPTPRLRVDLSFDLLAVKRALSKIAFLAAFHCLGDAFLDDPLIPEWHKLVMAKTEAQAAAAMIRGEAFEPNPLIQHHLRNLKPHEHAVVVANVQMQGLVVEVFLFGLGFHHVTAMASETSNYSLSPGKGIVAICDSTTRKTRFRQFEDVIMDGVL